MMFMRLNTPIGSSLEYTDAKVRDVEAALRESFPCDSIVTTVGTDEGRNYARVRVLLKRQDQFARRRRRRSSRRFASACSRSPACR